MKKVAFVCTGNICRSPLAEIIFADKIKHRELSHLLTHDSLGTHSYHEGEKADKRSRLEAEKHGLSITHLAKQVRLQDIIDFDFLIAMDRGHVEDLRQMASQSHQNLNKILLMRDFEADPKFIGRDVEDPYYGGQHGFRDSYLILERCMDSLIDFIINH